MMFVVPAGEREGMTAGGYGRDTGYCIPPEDTVTVKVSGLDSDAVNQAPHDDLTL